MKHTYENPHMDLIAAQTEDILTSSQTGGEIGNVSKDDNIDWNL